MFILLVTAQQGAWDRPTCQLEAGRFLEYTDDEVKLKFSSLDAVAEELLLQLPALFAYESGAFQGSARVGHLKTIRKSGRSVRFSYVLDPGVRPIKADRLEGLVAHFGIGDFEMTRTHVAVKQGDLMDALREEGLLGATRGRASAQEKQAGRRRTNANVSSLADVRALHPEIVKATKTLYETQHYPEAIFNAFKAVEVKVREVSRLDLTGQDLMAQAFAEAAPKIHVAVEGGQSGRDEQRGFKFLFMGATVGIRNPKGHGFAKQNDPQRTLEYLAFASLLMRRLDDSLEMTIL